MFFLTSVFLLSLGVLCGATEEDVCKGPIHCFANPPPAPLDFPDSEEALDKICPILLPRVKCVLDYKKKCPDMPLMELDGLDEKLDDIYALFVEACDKDSDLNKVLSTHLPCIEKNIQSYAEACTPMVKEVLEEMTSHLNIDWDSEDAFPNDEDWAKYMCTKEALGMSCFVATTSVKCGEEAGEISGTVIDRFGVLDVLCPESIRDDIKALVALVQPLMELGVAAKEMVTKIK